MTAPRLVSVMDAARQLGISERHLRALIARGAVPAVRIGRRCLLSIATIEKIAAEGVGG